MYRNKVVQGRKRTYMRQIPVSVTDNVLAQRISRNAHSVQTYMASAVHAVLEKHALPAAYASAIQYTGYDPRTGKVNFQVGVRVPTRVVSNIAATLRDSLPSSPPGRHLTRVT